MNKKAGHSDNSARDWLDPLKSGCENEKTKNENIVEHDMEPPADGMLLAEFILETSYRSRRIIRQKVNLSISINPYSNLTNNLSRYLFIYPRKHCENIETTPSRVETLSKNPLHSV